jgi:hypothetical protein
MAFERQACRPDIRVACQLPTELQREKGARLPVSYRPKREGVGATIQPCQQVFDSVPGRTVLANMGAPTSVIFVGIAFIRL